MTGRKRKPLKKYKSRRKAGFARDVIRIITAFSFGLASSLYLYETGCTRAFSIWFGLTAGTMVFAGLELVSLVTARIFGREKSSVPLHVTLLIILILLLLFVIWYLLFMYEEPEPVLVVEERTVQNEPVVPEQTQEEVEVLPAPGRPVPDPQRSSYLPSARTISRRALYSPSRRCTEMTQVRMKIRFRFFTHLFPLPPAGLPDYHFFRLPFRHLGLRLWSNFLSSSAAMPTAHR